MARLKDIVIDSRHPAGLARFWERALDGYAIRPYDDAEVERLASLGLTPETDPSVALDGDGPTLFFQQTDVPKTARNRVHLDLATPDRRSEVDRLTALGARVRDQHDGFYRDARPGIERVLRPRGRRVVGAECVQRQRGLGEVAQRAVVVGAGIGGLTAALALARVGLRVSLIEQAPVLGEVGAGIQLTPNSMRVLTWLGLSGELDRLGFRPRAAETRDWRQGRTITTSPIDQSGAPRYLTIHRADLIDVLARAVADDERIELHLGEVVHAVRASTVAAVETDSGRTVGGDLVIGADGIHSVVRTALLGADRARYTGHVAWRGLIPVEHFSGDLVLGDLAQRVVAWWGPERHFVHYPIRGGRMINCVGVVEERAWQAESWVERGDKDRLVEEFRDWHPHVVGFVHALNPESCFKWGLFDRAPLRRWSDASVTLLGDACHPTLPFLAQGGALAIEDAAVLAGCLTQDDVPAALKRYETLRRPRTARLQSAAKRNGIIFHLTGIAARARNWVAQPASKRVLSSVFDYDAIAVGGLADGDDDQP